MKNSIFLKGKIIFEFELIFIEYILREKLHSKFFKPWAKILKPSVLQKLLMSQAYYFSNVLQREWRYKIKFILKMLSTITFSFWSSKLYAQKWILCLPESKIGQSPRTKETKLQHQMAVGHLQRMIKT